LDTEPSGAPPFWCWEFPTQRCRQIFPFLLSQIFQQRLM